MNKTFIKAIGLHVKLGLKPETKRMKLLQLADYVTLPTAPAVVDWTSKVARWPMYLNDQLGICAVASPGHMIQAWTAEDAGQPVLMTDKDLIQAYSDICGYDPRTGANDNGCMMSDVMAYWMKTGIGGKKIFGFVEVDIRNWALTKSAAYEFGGINLGINMPLGWQQQTGPNGEWEANAGQPNSWGGHSVPLMKLDDNGGEVITWGAKQKVTQQALAQYTDIAYIALSYDWLNGDAKTVSGFDVQRLIADIKAMGGNVGPSPYPDTPTPPTPPPVPPTPPTPQGYQFVGDPMKVPMFGGTVTPTGRVVSKASMQVVSINWFSLMLDLRKLASDLKAVDIGGMVVAVKSAIVAVKARDWIGVQMQAETIAKLLAQGDWLVILEDVKAIIAKIA